MNYCLKFIDTSHDFRKKKVLISCLYSFLTNHWLLNYEKTIETKNIVRISLNHTASKCVSVNECECVCECVDFLSAIFRQLRRTGSQRQMMRRRDGEGCCPLCRPSHSTNKSVSSKFAIAMEEYQS